MIKKVISVCDGMSCGRIALERLGIKPEKYYASEIDKYAIAITQKNYPDTIQLGDINNYDMWEFVPDFTWDNIDLLIGGTPCQDLSIAKQGRKGLDGSRSGLFWRYVEILEKAKPKYFLLENVASMKDSERDIISNILGVEPIMINSALVSAQQRKRYYWTNIPCLSQPEDRGLVLADIVEYDNTAGEDYSNQWSFNGVRDLSSKAKCMSAAMYKGKRAVGMTSVAIPCAMRTWPRKAVPGVQRTKRIELKQDGKANSLTSVQTDSMVLFNKPDRIGTIGSNSQGNRVYSVYGKSVTLSANGGGTRRTDRFIQGKYP